MTLTSKVLFVQLSNGWRILTQEHGQLQTEFVDDNDADETHQLLREAIQSRWPRGGQCIIVIESSSVASVPLQQVSGLSHRRHQRHQELAYEVEGFVPWPAEEMAVVAWEEMSVAIQGREWQQLVALLRSLKFDVKAIVPRGWLNLQEALSQVPTGERAHFLLESTEGLQHWIIDERRHPAKWTLWPARSEEFDCEQLDQLFAEVVEDERMTLFLNRDLSPRLIERLNSQSVTLRVLGAAADEDETLWNSAKSCWKHSTLMNLAVGPLAGLDQERALLQAVKMCCWSFLLFSTIAAAALAYKAEQQFKLTHQALDEQSQLFQETFPGVRAPQGIAGRFESEHRRVLGLRGADAPIELPQPAANLLKRVLQAHVIPVRSRFEEIDIRNRQIEIECEFRNHQDAAAMVKQLEGAGIVLSPPQFQKIDDLRIGSRLRGVLAPAGGGKGP